MIRAFLLVIGAAANTVTQTEILLWPNGQAPGSEGKAISPDVDVAGASNDGLHCIAGIHRPSITANAPASRARPAFQALVCPGALPAGETVPSDDPPAFLCVAADDKAGEYSGSTLSATPRHGHRTAELHIYSNGGHGFGMKNRAGMPVTSWPERFREWLAQAF